MRPRTFILGILAVLLIAVVAVLVFLNLNGGLGNILGGGDDGVADVSNGDDGVADGDGDVDDLTQIPPTPTAEPQFQNVVVSRLRIPVGTMITSEYLTVEERPVTNIALLGGYTFTDTTALNGRIARVEIARGQEVLGPMVTNDPTDIGSLGSDLGLHIPPGQVAVAFAIDELSGVGLAMRPGDLVDMLVTLQTVEIDPEFRTTLPNDISIINQTALLEGREFLFPTISEGRLEFITELNQVALIIPKTENTENILDNDSLSEATFYPIPKRTTQLFIQQSEVLYVGQYQDPRELDRQQQAAQEAAEAAAENPDAGPVPTPTPIPSRLEDTPSVVILSMTLQDALALKWAREEGVDIDLALRSPTDNTVFVTTSVSLPQIIDQGALAIPEPVNFDIVQPAE